MRSRARAFSFYIAVMLVLSACGAGPTPPPTQVPISTNTIVPVIPATATKVPVGKTITVTNIDDAGSGSLRQAVQDAQPGDIINFDPSVFPPAAPAAIMLRSELDPIMQGYITIDASQAGVILDGGQAGGEWNSCILLASEHNTIRGLQCIHFTGPGLQLTPEGRFNTIGGDPDLGSGPLGQGNLFSENSDGIALYGSDNVIAGNRVGTDASGTLPMGNRGPGIFLDEGASRNHIGPRNIIAYNGTSGYSGGVEIRGAQSGASQLRGSVEQLLEQSTLVPLTGIFIATGLMLLVGVGHPGAEFPHPIALQEEDRIIPDDPDREPGDVPVLPGLLDAGIQRLQVGALRSCARDQATGNRRAVDRRSALMRASPSRPG